MTLSKPIKILVGIATLLVALFPVFFLVIWFSTFSSFFLNISSGSRHMPFGPPSWFFILFPVIFFNSILQLALQAYYIIHVIKNSAGTDVIRIILAIGFYMLPFIALPAYYLIYIWPDQPPAWAVRPPVLTNTALTGANS